MRKSGYIALLGRTNVGKSTFLNSILGRKIAIVSAKPQTTRRRLLGIKTDKRGQMVFFDCPGVHKPHFRLNEMMMNEVEQALHDADIILYFVDMAEPQQDEFILAMIRQANKKTFLVINKIDQFAKARILQKIDYYKNLHDWQEIVPISALKGENLAVLEDLLLRYLPEGDDFYAAETFTVQSDNFFFAEIIREKLLELIRDELPFVSLVRVEEIADRGPLLYVRGEIVVETTSQKKIVIGKKGGLIKAIGSAARQEMENLSQRKVYLDLYVRVIHDWRNSAQLLQGIYV